MICFNLRLPKKADLSVEYSPCNPEDPGSIPGAGYPD